MLRDNQHCIATEGKYQTKKKEQMSQKETKQGIDVIEAEPEQ